MPYAVPVACSQPLCPRPAVDRGRCALHQRTMAERGYGVAHQAARARLRGTLPTGCGYCGVTVTSMDRWVAAHRTDGDPRAGWMVAHADCNERAKESRAPVKASRSSYARVPNGARFVHVVGRPGSGKSYLARALARDLGIPHLDIADQPGHLTDPQTAWSSLRSRMTRSAIIESAGTSRYEQTFWRGLDPLVVVCAAPDAVRTERLQVRSEAQSEPGYVRRMLAIPQPAIAGYPWSGVESIPGARYSDLLGAVGRHLEPVEEVFLLA